ncbi:methylornithine synthase PylB [uncultured Bilophila sp.]|uniref:methylornithine synthase PylB n=7 Tax=uncultured Bilophila sp. TaxID=529385 RepID=UPI0025EC84BA|nr:methylornithine synthase PylB [uncultured Bilophila sp.]
MDTTHQPLESEAPLNREALIRLFDAPESERPALFARARAARERVFGSKVFLYGFLYLSTHCRNDCAFCHYRRSNTALARYRKSTDELLEAARRLASDGVHLLDLTLGEDPYYVEEPGFSRLTELVSALRQATGLPIMVSPGVLPAQRLARLREAGADWYACYQETHIRKRFEGLRLGQDYDVRRRARLDAASCGLLAEDGLLTGLGESAADLADSILAMRAEPLAQVRAMSYVPHPTTLPVPPAAPETRRTRELLAIAAMRLAMPDRLIPASLDVDGLEGLAARLEAGANVVTSIVPSGCGLAGVASEDLDIENERRGVAAVVEGLRALGLEPAAPAEYREWVRSRAQGRKE